LVQDLFVLGSTQQEGTATDIVDLASHTLGMLVDAGDEAVTEELALIASNAKVVLDVTCGLFEVKGLEVVADDTDLAS